MSTDERKPNPNATIQLDQIEGALDQVQFDSAPSLPTSSKKPPPLPPLMPMVSGAPPTAVVISTVAEPAPAKKLGAGVIAGFVVLLALAIGGGLYVGFHAPAKAAPAASVTPVPSAPPAVAATASASASVQHFTLPTME